MILRHLNQTFLPEHQCFINTSCFFYSSWYMHCVVGGVVRASVFHKHILFFYSSWWYMHCVVDGVVCWGLERCPGSSSWWWMMSALQSFTSTQNALRNWNQILKRYERMESCPFEDCHFIWPDYEEKYILWNTDVIYLSVVSWPSTFQFQGQMQNRPITSLNPLWK